jgi:hypothetical protein
MMVQAKYQDQEPVLLLQNFADGEHAGYAGDVVLLPGALAQQLIEAGAATTAASREEVAAAVEARKSSKESA